MNRPVLGSTKFGFGAFNDTRTIVAACYKCSFTSLLGKPDTGCVGDTKMHRFDLRAHVTYIRATCAIFDRAMNDGEDIVTDVPETEPVYQYRTWEKGPARTQCTSSGFCFMCQYLEATHEEDDGEGNAVEYEDAEEE